VTVTSVETADTQRSPYLLGGVCALAASFALAYAIAALHGMFPGILEKAVAASGAMCAGAGALALVLYGMTRRSPSRRPNLRWRR
jgi:hypothetical protein